MHIILITHYSFVSNYLECIMYIEVAISDFNGFPILLVSEGDAE
jgi:hypothetical protein